MIQAGMFQIVQISFCCVNVALDLEETRRDVAFTKFTFRLCRTDHFQCPRDGNVCNIWGFADEMDRDPKRIGLFLLSVFA
jgi:hypothetical protein